MAFLKEYEDRYQADARKALLLQWLTARGEELFKELREFEPIFETPDFFLVTRYDDVKEVLTHDHFSVEPYRETGSGDFILGKDGAEHDDARAALALETGLADLKDPEAFKKILEEIRPVIIEEAEVLAAQVVSAGYLDLPIDCRSVPVKFACSYFLGIPDMEAQSVGNWTQDMFHALQYLTFTQSISPNPVVEKLIKERGGKAKKEMEDSIACLVAQIEQELRTGSNAANPVVGGTLTEGRLIRRMIQRRRSACPQSARGQDCTPIPDDNRTRDIPRNLTGIINGMIDNVNITVNNALEVLFRPRNQESLQTALGAAKEGNRELLLPCIWEALRFKVHPPFLPRLCREDHVFAEETNTKRAKSSITIPKGARVLAALCSAMMDETVIHDPSQFDLGRGQDLYLYFGAGRHVCFGRAIAEVQIVEIVKSLLEKLTFKEIIDQSYRSSEPIQHPLTAIMTIKSPEDAHANALQLLLAEKYPEVRKALARVGTVHFARFVFLENNTKLALMTTYDGSFEHYIKNYIELAGDLFDAMLEHMKGAPPRPVQKYRQEFIEYVRSIDAPVVAFYSAYPTLTVQNILIQEAKADGHP